MSTSPPDRRIAVYAPPADASRCLGRVMLVGAGPGDPDLLTIRAVRAIERADVILYDKLVNPDILDFARADASRIDVGKRCGRPSPAQEAINRLILHHARRGAQVVRLKGGDPFIFGRGGEELDALREAGVSVDIVPGVTAASAAAASLGIPLTHRGIGRTLHFLNGHGRDGSEVDHDWRALVRPDATVVLYMGARRLDRITHAMMESGVAPAMPAVAIENATLPCERRCAGSVGTIASILAAAGFDGPTLIIVGEVVARAFSHEIVDLAATRAA